MAIQNEMYKLIDQEIDNMVEDSRYPYTMKVKVAKEVAKMLTDLSISPSDAESLTNQYIAGIRNICK